MPSPEVVAAPSRVRVVLTAPVTKRCPFRDEVDTGTIELRFVSAGQTLELHALAERLAKQKDSKISHEAFTKSAATAFAELLGAFVMVTTRWVTAGVEVSCEYTA